MSDSTEGEPEYNLLMPFVVCQSEGGPYDDEAFVAGYTCAVLEQKLQTLAVHRATPPSQLVRAPHLPQFDLIAMLHGYKIHVGDIDEASGWTNVTFEHVGTAP